MRIRQHQLQHSHFYISHRNLICILIRLNSFVNYWCIEERRPPASRSAERHIATMEEICKRTSQRQVFLDQEEVERNADQKRELTGIGSGWINTRTPNLANCLPKYAGDYVAPPAVVSHSNCEVDTVPILKIKIETGEYDRSVR